MSLIDLLDKYRTFSFSERDKGDRFERLIQAYLQTDPKYVPLFKYVWLWNEFPGRKDFGGKDTGIDLVAMTHEGDYWAIQCKCYAEGASIDKPSVDSFLSTSSRSFLNDQLQTIHFSQRLWISTTNKWGGNAEEAIQNQNPPVSRLSLYDLQEAPVDWEKLENGIVGELARTVKKESRKHQLQAIEASHEYFKEFDRGKLIMACGSGKTFTSLKIAEKETAGEGFILFLVPSIALLGQTLQAWTADSEEPINAICICSDSKITKAHSKNNDLDSTSVVDLALPASTNTKSIVKQLRAIEMTKKPGMTVIFSTYQSIDVISKSLTSLKADKSNFSKFDLIICDEAHRTTGVTLAGNDESSFVKVHNNDFLESSKRLYMTATPRLFSEDSKSKAAMSEAELCSMDDEALYGKEIFRIGFGEAVENDLLTDYKVLVLTLNEKDIPTPIQKMISNADHEITSDDASKLIGCINALSKQVLGDEGLIKNSDPDPMKRAVAFCQNISVSKKITSNFNTAGEVYLDSLEPAKKEKLISVSSNHIDGSMSAPHRDELLGWLKSTAADSNECRILTNVRCLSEGVDVPSLDAVLFLSARNSQVDVVQSVGRVMRKSPGKKYGYIIIPVVVPSNIEPEVALDDNERFKVVWSVLNALRAHDDRFEATINKIDLNKKKPGQILVGGITHGDDSGSSGQSASNKQIEEQLIFQFEELQNHVFAKMVQKVGDKVYWEKWAKDVAQIAENQIARIKHIIEENSKQQKRFEAFLKGLQNNINPSITRDQAIEMLSQHIITKPVFEALFEGYSFVKNNPISTSMQSMLDLIEDASIKKDTAILDKFYESVKKRASGIDNAEGKQRIIVELYDKFFKTAFPKMVEQLGIVYTPVEVVDFIIHSVNDVLKEEFGRSLTDENIHILDPFTGTGTFITRLLQSGLITQKDLERKYKYELHANEIVLLAYYIANVNIENAYHDATEDPNDGIGKEIYTPFPGMCLTDSFQLGETEDNALISEVFPENSERLAAQKKGPIRVIIGNPPYSAGQKSENDNAQNIKYEALDHRISETYAFLTKATNKNPLYDSYIRAFRWSSDRLDSKNGGIIAFVSNGSWIESNSTDGLRKSFEKEFDSIYVLNLRGNQRTSGEQSRREGGKIFGSGSRATICITLLIKNPTPKNCGVHYFDIGDYLSREEKLQKLASLSTVRECKLKKIKPNEYGDWLSQRNDSFTKLISLAPDKKFNLKSKSFFVLNSMGISTNRDTWVYNYSEKKLKLNMESTINIYNQEVDNFQAAFSKNPNVDVKKIVSNDPTKISWSSSLIPKVKAGEKTAFESHSITKSMYRPFCKQNLYFGSLFIHRRSQFPDIIKDEHHYSPTICVSQSYKEGSVFISNLIADLHLNGDVQAFPLYYFKEKDEYQLTLFDTSSESKYVRRDGISDFIYERAIKQYGKSVTKEDIFYYVYGILHSEEYRKEFANDLKKMLPRLPLLDAPKDFWAFSKAGRKLADLHINYESVPAYDDVLITGEDSDRFNVEKMRFPKKGVTHTIHYNSRITISNIPEKAYEYTINGKSAIHWIMERYQVTVDKKSGIKNDPNDWSQEVGNPRYILDLLLSVINVSVQTVDIVNSLPKVSFE